MEVANDLRWYVMGTWPKDKKHCYLCGTDRCMQKMVVCTPCFRKIMKKQAPIPALFAEWSKEDALP